MSNYLLPDDKQVIEGFQKALKEMFQKFNYDDVTNPKGKNYENFLKYLKKNHLNLIGYIDISYIASWDKINFDFVSKTMKKIKYGFENPRFFQSLIHRLHEDQTVNLGKGKYLEAYEVGRSVDKICNEGMEDIAKCLRGFEVEPYHIKALGEGTGLPSAGDKALFAEKAREDIFKKGSFDIRGTTMYLDCGFERNTEGFTAKESAIFNSEDNTIDRILNHNVFDSADYVEHVQGVDNLSSGTVIYQCPA